MKLINYPNDFLPGPSAFLVPYFQLLHLYLNILADRISVNVVVRFDGWIWARDDVFTCRSGGGTLLP